MKRQHQRHEAADANASGVTQLLGTFFAMGAAEWRKLVADVAHAFAGKPHDPAGTIEEKRFGDQ